MVYRNNSGRLGAGFISVCLETRWLGQKRGVCVPELSGRSRLQKVTYENRSFLQKQPRNLWSLQIVAISYLGGKATTTCRQYWVNMSSIVNIYDIMPVLMAARSH